MKRYYIFFVLLAAVSVAAIVAQVIMSKPLKADRGLSRRLQDTNEQVQLYAARNEKLPVALSQVEGDHAGIAYKATSKDSYELCATFQTNAQRESMDPSIRPTYIDADNHPKGYHCYKLVTESGAMTEVKPVPAR